MKNIKSLLIFYGYFYSFSKPRLLYKFAFLAREFFNRGMFVYCIFNYFSKLIKNVLVAERFLRSMINVASVRDLFGSRVCYLPQI